MSTKLSRRLLFASLIVLPSVTIASNVAGQAEAKIQVTRTFRDPVSGLKFVLIPAGSFVMGSRFADTQPQVDQRWFIDEQPPHNVSITRPFWLASTETTVSAFRAFVEETGYVTTAERIGESLGRYELSTGADGNTNGQWVIGKGLSWRSPGWPIDDTHPVVHVSWEDATAFVQWLSDKSGRPYRLPTEAEWEYAAGGATHATYSWGNDEPTTGREGNIADARFAEAYPRWKYPVLRSINDGFVHTAPVGAFSANSWGLFDMTGNVWEWCADRYSSDAYGALDRTDPQGPHSGLNRVHRGGGFDWELSYLRVAKRRGAGASMTAVNVGFRVALSN